MYFQENSGLQGGCFLLDSTSTLTDNGSVYEKNSASQGGVVFAINDSKFNFTKNKFLSNSGIDGSVLYAMYNSGERALSFSDCELSNNSAE